MEEVGQLQPDVEAPVAIAVIGAGEAVTVVTEELQADGDAST